MIQYRTALYWTFDNYLVQNKDEKLNKILKSCLPINFLETNLGPTFMSEKLVEEVYQLRKKDYLYKETSTGELATHYTHLVDKNHGAAIRTYRAEQELKSRFPRAFWEWEHSLNSFKFDSNFIFHIF